VNTKRISTSEACNIITNGASTREANFGFMKLIGVDIDRYLKIYIHKIGKTANDQVLIYFISEVSH
jgi:hypothetical protein